MIGSSTSAKASTSMSGSGRWGISPPPSLQTPNLEVAAVNDLGEQFSDSPNAA